ncbi:MAG: sensor domain-containing diguanylate cyclase [Spirochaetes bacterium]|nr:sensor domain-containing diguanylate cyclase [Spirochaetota bacterium]
MEKPVKQLYANIGKLITSSLKFNQILKGIMEEIHLFFKPEYWSLLRLDEAAGELFFVIFNGPVLLQDVKDVRLKIGEGVAGTAAKTKSPYFVQDTSKEKNFSNKVDTRTGFTTKSIIAVPMVCRDKVYGVIEIINPADRTFFSEGQVLILQTIADFSAIAFANSALYETVIELSHIDSLTGVYNRTRFDMVVEQMEKAESNHRRSNEKEYVSAIAVDLNNFKEINDTYGHLTGDDVLKAAAVFFKKCIRGDDVLFRLGGDEFIILLESAALDQLETARDRIIGLLENGNRKTLIDNIKIDYSFGHATGKRTEIKKIIGKADSHMYSTKKKSNIIP